MSHLIQRALASPFVRNVAVLSSGTALAQVATAAATPVLSRLYDPVHFGLFALFASVVSILAEAASGRFELAIVLPKEDDDALDVLGLALICVGATSVAALLATALAGGWVAARLGEPSLASLLWWVPPALLVIGVFRSLSNWATRKKRFPVISLAQIVRALGIVTVQIISGFAGVGAVGLIGGRTAGETAAAGALWTRLGDAVGRLRGASWSRMRALASEYADFPKYNLPQSLINAFSQSVAVFLLAGYFGAAVAGIYGMAHRLLVLPSRLISQSVRQVFFQRAGEAHARGLPVFPLLARTTFGLAGVVVLPVVIVVFAGPWIFGFVLGEEWIPAGHYARWMALWLFFVYINPPAVVLAQVLRKNHYLLIYDAALLVCRLAVLAFAGSRYDALTAVALFAGVGAVFNAGWIVFMLGLSRKAEAS